jgi:hypothetical protein
VPGRATHINGRNVKYNASDAKNKTEKRDWLDRKRITGLVEHARVIIKRRVVDKGVANKPLRW